MKQGLWTARQAAAFLGVQLRTMSIWRYLRRYPLPFVKKGRRVYYSRADVRAFARTYPDWCKKRTGPTRAAWWTGKQVAAFLGVGRGTLAEWRRKRRYALGYVKENGRVRYPRAKVLAFGKAYAVLKWGLEQLQQLKQERSRQAGSL
jgi:hypothetical protein